MKESNLISLSVALILLFGDCFCLDRDAASSSNQRYTDYSSDINQERKKAIQDTLSRERDACSYLNKILPPENSISRNGSIRVRNNMFVAYYKYLGGTYNRGSGHTFQSTIYTKVAKYLGFAGKTVFNKLLNLRNEFNEIEPVNIKGLVAEIVANYESHPDNDSLRKH